jgi:ABC-type multidrug transport system fused ATPase/permease subunit
LVRLIRELIRPYRGTIAIILAAMAVQTLMSLAGPWPLAVILDVFVGAHHLPKQLAEILQPWLHAGGKVQIGLFAALASVLIALIGGIASYFANYYTESVGQWVAHDLRMRTYHHLQRLSLSYYDSHQVGTLLSTITADIGTIQSFASSATLGILVDLMTIIGMLVLMFYLNWDFALIAVAVTPFLLLFISHFNKAVKAATKEVRKRQSDIVTTLEQGLESVRVVKAFGREELQESQLSSVSQATVDAALKARKVKSLLSPIVTVVVAVCVGIVLWRGSILMLAGTMSAGALTVFLSYLNKFFKPVQDLAKMTNTIAQTAVGVDRVREIIETDTIIPEKPDARAPESLKGKIAFENVAFGYTADSPVLRDVTFTITPGEIVGIVGPTGGGKSTVVSMIPRFYDPSQGRVLVDEVDIRDFTVQGLRKHVGFVLQDTVLFHGTIRENIAYGRPDATEEDILEAAKQANADEFIAKMPHGYDTMVGDRGLTLSGGQRQRIGIARALIRNNPILILDEPTAALDSESEARVIEALERLMKGRTVIMIAHRLSTIRDANKIIVLKGGVVAEQGNHAELMALNGVYAELHKIQYESAAAANS